MKVLFLPEVSQRFVELAEVLYDKGYMSFLDTAIEYSESLFREIQVTLGTKAYRRAPKWFDQFGKGMLYAQYPKNNHTTWYVFFNIYEIEGDFVYLVRYMSNNHVIGHHLDLGN